MKIRKIKLKKKKFGVEQGKRRIEQRKENIE